MLSLFLFLACTTDFRRGQRKLNREANHRDPGVCSGVCVESCGDEMSTAQQCRQVLPGDRLSLFRENVLFCECLVPLFISAAYWIQNVARSNCSMSHRY